MNPIQLRSETPRAPRYDSLDIWRGVACLAVVVFHVAGHDRRFEAAPEIASVEVSRAVSAGLSKLWLGVPLFFVISGYCIAATCDSARRNDRSFGWYMRRRLRRIFPPYWACLAVIAIAVRFGVGGDGIGDPFQLTAAQWVGNLTLTEQWRPRLFGEYEAFVLAAAWTLCYEEQFYLACGVLLAVMRRSFFAGLAALTLLTMPLAVLNWSGAADLHGFFFDGFWLQFAAGVFVYHGRNYPGAWGQRPYIGLLLGAAAGLVALRLALPKSIVHGLSREAFLDGTALAFAFAAMLLLIGRWDAAIAGAAALRPIRACGIMCYSLYLTHQPVIDGVRMAITRLGFGSSQSTVGAGAAVATLFCAIMAAGCFYWLVERRFLNTPTMLTALKSRPERGAGVEPKS